MIFKKIWTIVFHFYLSLANKNQKNIKYWSNVINILLKTTNSTIKNNQKITHVKPNFVYGLKRLKKWVDIS